MASGTSNWKYDPARDCYVEQATGFTATYESLLSAKSDAVFEARQVATSGGLLPGALNANAYYSQQQALRDQAYWQARINEFGSSSLTVTSAPPLVINTNKPDDEFTWLRRRVEEVCWKAA